jgi:hypothetical protein
LKDKIQHGSLEAKSEFPDTWSREESMMRDKSEMGFTVKLSPAIVALVLGLVFNALAVAYSAGIITQRVDSIDRRLQAIERILFERVDLKQ